MVIFNFFLYNKAMKKQRFIFLFVFILLVPSVFFANEFSADEQAVMEKVTDFRWHLFCDEDYKSVAKKCDDFKEYIDSFKIKLSLSEECFISIENILTWEKYNALYEINPSDSELEDFLTAQYKKIRFYFRNHKKDVHNKWLYVTAGDILSSSLQYLPLTTAMNEGLTIKKYYDKALEIDSNFVFCLINIGQWYFHAPAVSGGGKKKAMNAFIKAESSATSDAEKFYAKLYLSQCYFDFDDKEKAAALLDECESLLPETRIVKFYRLLNENGFCYFEYPQNRKKIDLKLKKTN